MKYLVDTNIILEILLNQVKKQDCETFIVNNMGDIVLSEFSLYSIGLNLYRKKEFISYKNFIADIDSLFIIKSLDTVDHIELINNIIKYKLDYDDSYQITLAQKLNLPIITFDKDFDKLKMENLIQIINL